MVSLMKPPRVVVARDPRASVDVDRGRGGAVAGSAGSVIRAFCMVAVGDGGRVARGQGGRRAATRRVRRRGQGRGPALEQAGQDADTRAAQARLPAAKPVRTALMLVHHGGGDGCAPVSGARSDSGSESLFNPVPGQSLEPSPSNSHLLTPC